tara:strand:+ start:86 stop:607 length:522 start_codon:yes stop_codon:yes gene_type:complete
MNHIVTDNFLDHHPFQHLQNVMFGNDFNWFYNDGIDIEDEESGGRGDKFQFFHSFYNTNVGVNSYQFEELNSILNKIQPKEIFKIKANLLTRTSEIVKNTFHVDIEDFSTNKLPWKTGVLYMNTNNGYTEFEDGTVVESVANRMLIFPTEMKHRGTSCTDAKVRIIINLNFVP